VKKNHLHIIKIGGQVAADSVILDQIAQRIAAQENSCLLVHGGGPQLNARCHERGIPVHKHEGRRITSAAVLEEAVACWAGTIQKKIISSFRAYDVPCIGLTGADLACITSIKRSVQHGVDYGLVGDIIATDVTHIEYFLNYNILPIVSPITSTSTGQLLNTNADTVATALAHSLATTYDVSIHYITDVPGVLQDITNINSIIPTINSDNYSSIAHHISDGMKPKIENALSAVKSHIHAIQISDVHGLFKNSGTWIQ